MGSVKVHFSYGRASFYLVWLAGMILSPELVILPFVTQNQQKVGDLPSVGSLKIILAVEKQNRETNLLCVSLWNHQGLNQHLLKILDNF